jgi:hypothetical protein
VEHGVRVGVHGMCSPTSLWCLRVWSFQRLSGGGIFETMREIITSGTQVLKRLFDNVFLLEFFSEVFNTTTINTEV